MASILPKSISSLMGLGQAGGGIINSLRTRLPELVEPAKFVGVGTAWTVLDIAGHQLLKPLEGSKTPNGYYRNKLIWAMPALLGGRIVSDWIGGPDILRAATLGTVANGLIQLRYLFSMPKDFNLTCFLLHEAILIPLSLFIIGRPGDKVTGY